MLSNNPEGVSMQKLYKPHIPQTVGQLWDHLGSMMLSSPKFEDNSGYFPGMGIDIEFQALVAGLEVLRPVIGEDRYLKLGEMSRRMRAHFEADPEDKTDDTLAGRDIIVEMEEILKEVNDPADHPNYAGTRG
jgi:hypothetical protein